MAGKQARYSFRSDNRKETYSDVHAVNVVNSLFKDGQSIKKNLVPYTGKVYCIETSTGAFIIRYNKHSFSYGGIQFTHVLIRISLEISLTIHLLFLMISLKIQKFKNVRAMYLNITIF